MKKLDTRSINSYLIGYNASNIYRIWQPKNWYIVCLRDVIIDESIVGIEPILENAGTKPVELIIPSEPDPILDSGGEILKNRAQHKSDSESEHELEQ
jgi:hypothetical protein